MGLAEAAGGGGPAVHVRGSTWALFAAWTAALWGGTGACAALFYVGSLSFSASAKTGLYCASVWLNACLLPLLPMPAAHRPRSRRHIAHEVVVLWLLSYATTNMLWEIPWLACWPWAFDGIDTLAQVEAQSAWMRASPLHMYWWVVASFAAVDLRTVNGNGTFLALELFAFPNVALVAAFLVLNRRAHPLRYAVPALGFGVPLAATFIFSFSEVFAGFPNMAGGVADTLLALAWTQYQYILYPCVCALLAWRLLMGDLAAAGRLPPPAMNALHHDADEDVGEHGDDGL